MAISDGLGKREKHEEPGRQDRTSVVCGLKGLLMSVYFLRRRAQSQRLRPLQRSAMVLVDELADT